MPGAGGLEVGFIDDEEGGGFPPVGEVAEKCDDVELRCRRGIEDPGGDDRPSGVR